MSAPSPRLITETGAFDLAAIGAEISARYQARRYFFEAYTGEPRRYWQRQLRRQVCGAVWREARDQQHSAIFRELRIVYTPDEQARLKALAWADPLRISDAELYSPEYRNARAEADGIRRRARERAYTAARAAILKSPTQRRAA